MNFKSILPSILQFLKLLASSFKGFVDWQNHALLLQRIYAALVLAGSDIVADTTNTVDDELVSYVLDTIEQICNENGITLALPAIRAVR